MTFDFKIDILDPIREFLTGKTDCLNCNKWFDMPKQYEVEFEDYQAKYEFCSNECKINYEKRDAKLI